MAGNDKAPTWVDAMLDGRMYEFGPNGRKRMKRKPRKARAVSGYVVALVDSGLNGDTLIANEHGDVFVAYRSLDTIKVATREYNNYWKECAKVYKLVEVKGL